MNHEIRLLLVAWVNEWDGHVPRKCITDIEALLASAPAPVEAPALVTCDLYRHGAALPGIGVAGLLHAQLPGCVNPRPAAPVESAPGAERCQCGRIEALPAFWNYRFPSGHVRGDDGRKCAPASPPAEPPGCARCGQPYERHGPLFGGCREYVPPAEPGQDTP